MFPITLCTNYKDILVTIFMFGPSMKRKPKQYNYRTRIDNKGTYNTIVLDASALCS